ncbi:ABC transporter permease [Achromobacter pestifer]
MKGFGALYRKELRTDFGSPVALVVVAVFWALSGYLFSFNLFFVSTGQMVTAFHNMTILLILVMPLVSMRAFAEEARQGTLELLLTLPLSDATLVAAKYAAGLTVLALMLAGTTAAVLPLAWYGQPDYGPIVGGYVGVFLYGALFLAIGIAVSSTCTNQIVAASATWGILVLLWFIDYPAALDAFPALSPFFQALSLSAQHVDFIRGVLPGPATVMLASLTMLALMIAAVNLKRWRLR